MQRTTGRCSPEAASSAAFLFARTHTDCQGLLVVAGRGCTTSGLIQDLSVNADGYKATCRREPHWMVQKYSKEALSSGLRFPLYNTLGLPARCRHLRNGPERKVCPLATSSSERMQCDTEAAVCTHARQAS